MDARIKMTMDVLIFIFYLLMKETHAQEHWGYKGAFGPSKWSSLFPSCSGRSQSPIDLRTESSFRAALPKFQFQGYDQTPNFLKLENNGHTVKLTMGTRQPVIISGAGLPGQYKFLQLHFHWGSSNNIGSEHLLNGKLYPLEMHLVHVNTKYPDTATALTQKDGLAVIGVMFQVGRYNRELGKLTEALSSVRNSGESTTSIKPIILRNLLPNNPNTYFRYLGSLTTPKCNEVVTWTVITEPLELSLSQILEFRSLNGKEREKLVDNFRPPQPVNGRLVQFAETKPETPGTFRQNPESWSYEGMTGNKLSAPVRLWLLRNGRWKERNRFRQ